MLSCEAEGQIVVERGIFELYKTVLADTHEVSKRRENLESGYITLMTFALAGDGYLAATTRFDNWLPVVLSTGIGLFALAATARYSRALRTLVATLNNRYAWLRNLETTPELAALGATVLTEEYKHVYHAREAGGAAARVLNLSAIFVVAFLAIPLLLAALTITAHIPEVHQLIHPLAMGK